MKIRVDGMVWLPLSELKPVQIGNMKRELTVIPQVTSEFADEKPDPIILYRETDAEFGIPWAFFQRFRREAHEIDFVRMTRNAMRPEAIAGGFTGAISGTSRFDEQTRVVNDLIAWYKANEFGGRMVRASTGFGKTSLGLRVGLGLGVKTLILSHKEVLLEQWVKRIRSFFPGARVGVIRQSRCEFKGVDFAVGLFQSLHSREYPSALYSAFDLTIVDEAHRASARTFCGIAPMFDARWRLGLTATPRRKDATERVFFEHLGEIAYSAKTEAEPFVVSPLVVNLASGREYTGKSGRVRMEADIARSVTANVEIARSMAKAAASGRKILVVSSRVEHLWEIEQLVKPMVTGVTVGWVSGQVYDLDDEGRRVQVQSVDARGRSVWKWRTRKPSREELEQAESAQIILATRQMIEEGWDVPAIDTIYSVAPVSDMEQLAGRGRRPCLPEASKCAVMCPWRKDRCQGKPKMVLKDVVHHDVPRLVRAWGRRLVWYRQQQAKVVRGGSSQGQAQVRAGRKDGL